MLDAVLRELLKVAVVVRTLHTRMQRLAMVAKGLTQGHKSEFDSRAVCCHRPSSSRDVMLPPYGVLAGQG